MHNREFVNGRFHVIPNLVSILTRPDGDRICEAIGVGTTVDDVLAVNVQLRFGRNSSERVYTDAGSRVDVQYSLTTVVGSNAILSIVLEEIVESGT